MLDYKPEAITDIRERLLLNQAEFAQLLGCTRNQVCRWETGKVRRIQAKFLRELDKAAERRPLRYTPALLKELRKRLRMRQADLADALGAEISSVKFWETDRRKQQAPETMKKLDALAVKAGMFA